MDLADLPRLQHRVAAPLALGAFQQVDAILGQPLLQQVQAVGRSNHQPVGSLQGQLHVVGQFDIAREGRAVVGQGRLDLRQDRRAVAVQLALQRLAGLEDGIGLLVEPFCMLTVAGQGEGLLALAHAQHLFTESAHALLQFGAGADLTQRQQAGGGHQRGQQQHQGKAQHQFAGRTQAGQPLGQ